MHHHVLEAGLLLVVLFGTIVHATIGGQRNPCHPHSCEYGECIAKGSSFLCKCQEDHVGPTCNVWRSPLINCDVDGPYVCFNGGVCNTTANNFRCACPPNFTGFFCEEDVNECLIFPCENGATCINRVGDYYCICPHGFKGVSCEERVELCSDDTCLHGGSCIGSTDGYVCECPRGYSGPRCEHAENDIVEEQNVSAFINNSAKCSHEDNSNPCDRKCVRPICCSDGSECISTVSKPFIACASSTYCSEVFRNGVCDEVCNTEACMFDGFDCTTKFPKCPDSISAYCEERKRDGVCNEPCNQEACDFDGGDCQQTLPKILPGEIFVVVQAKPYYFIANIPRFLSSLSQILRADARIKSDEKGPMVFLWKNGESGERVTIGKQNVSTSFYEHPDSTNQQGVLAWIEVDVGRCVSECFSDVEIVASFIEATSMEFSNKSMSIHSAVARKPKNKKFWGLLLFVVVTCISITIIFAIANDRSRRKRKVIRNAPIWIPPAEFEIEKQGEHNKGKNGRLYFIHGSTKRRCVDLSELGLLEKSLTPKLPSVALLPKPKKVQPVPSQLHIESASENPISFPLSAEEANQRGPYGRTPLMILARNTVRSDEQLIADVIRLHAIGADMNMCDDYDDTALHMAVSSGRVALVRKLLHLGASPVIRNSTNSTCLHLAARACTSDMISALLEMEEMRKEVDAVDDDNRTALMLVAMHDRVDTKAAQMLIEAGAVVNYDGDNSLVSWRGRTALHFAAKYDNAQMITFLVQKMAFINCQDYEYCTPLHLAAAEGHVGPVKELIQAGASVLMRNDRFQTAYDVALINDCHKVATLLSSGDNLCVRLYSNHGEILASSSSPKWKHSELSLARHAHASRHISCVSPGSTHSTPPQDYPDHYSTSSPYSYLTKPYFVPVCGTSVSSPQYPSTMTTQMTSPASTPQCVQPAEHSKNYIQLLENSGTFINGVSSPHYERMKKRFALSEELVEESSGYFDSGFDTFTGTSHYDHSAPYSSSSNGFMS